MLSALGHYRIVSPLGAGGMGEVYLATDTRLHRKVAIKVLPASTAVDKQAQRRMLREARMVATIDHPNVCTIYEIGDDEERPYIVMQYIQGETLAERMRRAQLSLAECVDIARQIAAALAEAHSRGIVHRDIKPGNIMISSTGVVKVLDFGLAKSFAGEASATEVLVSRDGVVAGTTSYMSPEQLRAEPLDGRSDIFSLGVVLYEMASGTRPFDRPTFAATITAILTENPPALESPLQPVIARALAKPLSRRFSSAAALIEALTAVGEGRPTTRKVTRERRRKKKEPRVDPAAEKLYLRGRLQWNKRHPEAVRQAIACFQEAVEIDPMYAHAFAGLADAYVMLGFLQALPARDVIPKAKAASLRAIELHQTLAEPHASLGYLAGIFEWDWQTAERELKEAMRLNPKYSWAPHWYGLLAAAQSFDESMKYVTLARDLDPLSPIINTAIGITLHLHRRYGEALKIYSSVLAAEPGFAPAHYYIGMSYEQLGDYDSALSNLNRAAEIAGRGALFLGALGHCLAVSGRPAAAQDLLQELDTRSRERYVSPYNAMLIHLGLGDIDTALTWLERGLEERTGWLWMTPVEPRFDPLRGDQRFRDLVASHGLRSQ